MSTRYFQALLEDMKSEDYSFKGNPRALRKAELSKALFIWLDEELRKVRESEVLMLDEEPKEGQIYSIEGRKHTINILKDFIKSLGMATALLLHATIHPAGYAKAVQLFTRDFSATLQAEGIQLLLTELKKGGKAKPEDLIQFLNSITKE